MKSLLAVLSYVVAMAHHAVSLQHQVTAQKTIDHVNILCPQQQIFPDPRTSLERHDNVTGVCLVQKEMDVLESCTESGLSETTIPKILVENFVSGVQLSMHPKGVQVQILQEWIASPIHVRNPLQECNGNSWRFLSPPASPLSIPSEQSLKSKTPHAHAFVALCAIQGTASSLFVKPPAGCVQCLDSVTCTLGLCDLPGFCPLQI